jgi:hypothetical protein
MTKLNVPCKRRDSWPIFLIRSPKHLEDTSQLFYVRRAVEERVLLSQDKLTHDTPNPPDVNCRPIVLRPKQDLRGSVTQSTHIPSHRLVVLHRKELSKPKVSVFDFPIRIDQNVLGLYVSMQDPVLMKSLQSFKNLL